MHAVPALAVAALVLFAGCTLPGLDAASSDGTGDVPGGQSPAATPAPERSGPTPQPPGQEPNVSATFHAGGDAVRVTLEVADSPGERATGLMYRESLPANHGMLFVFDEAATRSFWMKNTLIPLDMIFVAANGTVVSVEHAAVPPEGSTGDLRHYRSGAPAKYVVEVRRGFANRTGVGPGATLTFNGSEAPTPES